MTIDLKEYERLKQADIRTKEQIAKMAGAQESLTVTLMKNFETTTIEEAEQLQKRIDAEKSEVERQFSEGLEQLKKEFPELLK